MNRRRTAAIAKKEFLHVLRDPRSLGMGIAIPIFLLMLFGYGLSLDVSNVPLAVWDMDGSSPSRDLTRSFVNSKAFSPAGVIHSHAEVVNALQHGTATAVLVIPPQYSEKLRRGDKTQVQLLVDGSDSNTARLSMMYATGIVQRTGTPRRGVSMISAYNPAMDTTWSIIPGLIAIIVNVIAAMLTSLCVAREWENGTMEQLVSTPVRKTEFILGKLAPYYCIGIIDIVIAVIMALFLFGIPLAGSIFSLALVSGVFLLGALSVGMLISIFAGSQLLASQLALLTTFLPGFLLSGFVYDISAMPAAVANFTRIIPARYFVSLLRAIFLKGVWGPVLTLNLALLALFTAFVLGVSRRILHLNLDGR